MKRKYALEEAKKTDRLTEIEGLCVRHEGGLEGASVGLVEYRGRHGRTRQPAGDRIYLVLKGEGKFLFGNGQRDDELVPVTKYDVVLIPKDTTYDYPGRMRIFPVRVPTNEQDSDVHLDDLWE